MRYVLLVIGLLLIRIAIKLPSPIVINPWPIELVRQRVILTYQTVLPPADAELISGIALGNDTLNKQFKKKLANVGLSHVVAASGMNVSLVAGFVFWILNQIVANRLVKAVLGSAMILFYAALTGFDPPIVRATLMAVSILVAGYWGRKLTSSWGLIISGFLMLWVAPDLIVSPSFLLSFSAMAGQIYVSTIKLQLPILLAPLAAIFIQSLIAIIFTFPIVVVFFATFSPIALLSNVLVLWTVEPLMILSGLMATLGLIFTDFARACALPAQGLLDYFLWVVNTLSQSNWNIWPLRFIDPLSSVLFVTGYYLTLASGIWFIKNLKQKQSKKDLSF